MLRPAYPHVPVVSAVTDGTEPVSVLDPYVDILTERLHRRGTGESPARLYEGVRHAVSAAGTPLYGALTLAVADAVDTESDRAVVGDPSSDAAVVHAAVALEQVRSHGVVHADAAAGGPDGSCDTSAVLVGDALYARAFETLLGADIAADASREALRTLLTAARRSCEGRLRRRQFDRRDGVSASSYLDVLCSTAGELGGAAGRLGVRLADGSEDVAEQAAAYGRELGVAVALYDDVCALLDRPDGVVCARDAPAWTLPTIHARDAGVAVDRLVAAGDTDRLLAEFRRTDSLADTYDELTDRLDSALAAIPAFPSTGSADRLSALPDRLAERARWLRSGTTL
jgi:geranylgeranyl diphosphate synthase type I